MNQRHQRILVKTDDTTYNMIAVALFLFLIALGFWLLRLSIKRYRSLRSDEFEGGKKDLWLAAIAWTAYLLAILLAVTFRWIID